MPSCALRLFVPLMASLIVALIAALSSACASVAPPAAPRIGVQLWSVKDEIKQDFEGTLHKLANLGFEGVELAGEFGPFANDPAGLRAFLAKAGLRCAGAHTSFEALAPAAIDATTAFYQAAGCSNLIIAMDRRAATTQGAAQVALELRALAARLSPLGMRIGYHNHGEEMAGADGHTPWDVIASGTPAAVILQQDIGWTTHAGKDPVALIRRYPGRTTSAHFKAKSNAINIIGQDQADWRAIAAAAREVGGAEWFIVEQEEYPNGMGQTAAVAASLRGLQGVLARP